MPTNLGGIRVNVRDGVWGDDPGFAYFGRHYKVDLSTQRFAYTIDYFADDCSKPKPDQVLETFLQEALIGKEENRNAPASTMETCGQCAKVARELGIDPFDILLEMGSSIAV